MKAAGDDAAAATEVAENLCKEKQERGARKEEEVEKEVEPETEKESPSFDDLLSGDALAAFSNKCSSRLLLPSPVPLSHLQFLLGLSALAVAVAVYFFAF